MFDQLYILATGSSRSPEDEGVAGIYQVTFTPAPTPCPPASDWAGAAVDAFYGTYALTDPGAFSLRVFTAEGTEVPQDPAFEDGSFEELVDDIWRADEEDAPLFLFDLLIDEED